MSRGNFPPPLGVEKMHLLTGMTQPRLTSSSPGQFGVDPSAVNIPGLGGDLDVLRALETALRGPVRGSWQASGVPLSSTSNAAAFTTGESPELKSLGEAFLRDIEAKTRQQHEIVANRKRDSRHSKASKAYDSGSDDDSFKKRRYHNDSEEGEVMTRGRNGGSSYDRAPPENRRHGLSNGGARYQDLDWSQEIEADEAKPAELVSKKSRVSKTSKAAAPECTFDSMFSDYMSARTKDGRAAPAVKGTSSFQHSYEKPAPLETEHSSTMDKATAGTDLDPLLRTLGPSLRQGLSALGIDVPSGAFEVKSHRDLLKPNANLSKALSAFDLDIAKIGEKADLPPSVQVVVVDGDEDRSEQGIQWSAMAEEIAAEPDHIALALKLEVEPQKFIKPGNVNWETIATVQHFIPLIPQVERENPVERKRMMEKGKSEIPMLLPMKVVSERIFPPLRDSMPSRRYCSTDRAKSDMDTKARLARERINHLKIEQAMVEERLLVMGMEHFTNFELVRYESY